MGVHAGADGSQGYQWQVWLENFDELRSGLEILFDLLVELGLGCGWWAQVWVPVCVAYPFGLIASRGLGHRGQGWLRPILGVLSSRPPAHGLGADVPKQINIPHGQKRGRPHESLGDRASPSVTNNSRDRSTLHVINNEMVCASPRGPARVRVSR